MHKKDKIVIGIMIVIVFILVFGDYLFAFFCLPLHEDEYITIPEDRYVSWEELYERPEDIGSEMTSWFPNCLVRWQIRQLERYMKKNNLYIAPGEYDFYSTDYGDTLIKAFHYVDADTLESAERE